MPRSPLGWALTICVPALAIAVAFAVTGGGSAGTDVQARASAICNEAQRALRGLPHKPRSLAEALEFDHEILATARREVSELQALGPETSASFRAGLADDRSLLIELSSMLNRPDYIHLALTLPGHPNLVPTWLKKWLARTQALQTDARAQFSQAGIPACEKSLG
jgi:hypothetical protein